MWDYISSKPAIGIFDVNGAFDSHTLPPNSPFDCDSEFRWRGPTLGACNRRPFFIQLLVDGRMLRKGLPMIRNPITQKIAGGTADFGEPDAGNCIRLVILRTLETTGGNQSLAARLCPSDYNDSPSQAVLVVCQRSDDRLSSRL